MLSKSHIIIGVGAAIMAVPTLNLNVTTGVLCVAAAGIGSLAPDIDHPNSKIRRYIPIPVPLKHRGLTHSIVGVIGLMFLVSILIAPVPSAITPAAFFMLGYIAHIVADMLTVAGVMLFYPLETNVRLLPKAIALHTGSRLEYVLIALLGCVVVLKLFEFLLR